MLALSSGHGRRFVERFSVVQDIQREICGYGGQIVDCFIQVRKIYRKYVWFFVRKSDSYIFVIIPFHREQLPALLHKKDRGRPTEASIEIIPKQYGAVHAFEHIPGTEALLKPSKSPAVGKPTKKGKNVPKKEESDSDSEWEDVSHSEGEGEAEDNDEFVTDSEAEVEEESDDDNDDNNVEEEKPETECAEKSAEPQPTASTSKINKQEAMKELALTRIFTDEDFARIETQNLKKQVTNTKSRKRQATEGFERTDLVKLDNIEMIYKKRRTDKVARIESMKKDRQARETFGHLDKRHIHASTTNREKEKRKPFQMMRHKARGKIKKSFRDKQILLRNHLVKQKKMK
jgi:protein SDA1